MSNISPTDGRPPRIFRRVLPQELPHPNTVAAYDHATNVLRINNNIWEDLNATQRHIVERTTHPLTSLADIEYLRKFL